MALKRKETEAQNRDHEISGYVEELKSLREEAKAADTEREWKERLAVQLEQRNSEQARRSRNLTKKSGTAAEALERKAAEAARLSQQVTSLTKDLEQTSEFASIIQQDL